jgi:hypothetical protein
MFNFDQLNQLNRAALAMLGSLILTTTFVGAAVGPARAIETSPVVASAAQSSVQASSAQAYV